MSSDNPYEAPKTRQPDLVPAVDRPNIVTDLTEDAKGNIGLTSKIVRIAAIFSSIASLTAVMQIWATFRYYGLPNGWTPWHTLISLRILNSPCWLLLAWMLWRYGKSLDQLQANGIRDLETTIEQQAKLWLAIALLILVAVLNAAVIFGSSAAAIAPQ